MYLEILNKLYATHKAGYHSWEILLAPEFSEMSTKHDYK